MKGDGPLSFASRSFRVLRFVLIISKRHWLLAKETGQPLKYISLSLTQFHRPFLKANFSHWGNAIKPKNAVILK